MGIEIWDIKDFSIKDKLSIIYKVQASWKIDLAERFLFEAKKHLLTVLKHDKSIVSFWLLTHGSHLQELVTDILWLDACSTIIWSSLYTFEKHRWKWFAKEIKYKQKEILKSNWYKYLVWYTDKKYLADLYHKYWAKIIYLTPEQKEQMRVLCSENYSYAYIYYL